MHTSDNTREKTSQELKVCQCFQTQNVFYEAEMLDFFFFFPVLTNNESTPDQLTDDLIGTSQPTCFRLNRSLNKC